MFITFTNAEAHFLDNLENGFLLSEHPVTFDTTNLEIIEVVIDFWKQYKITGKLISIMIDLHTKHGSCNNDFVKELVGHIDSDINIRHLYSTTFNSIRAKVKMKCFTEIRDNQKINSHHTGYFGNYGIILNQAWMHKMKGAPVIYVDKKNVMSMLLAKTSAIMNTLDSAVAMFADTKASISGNNFFDLFSFFEISDHSYEYEWRIVSGHNLYGGSKIFPKRDRLTFTSDDVEAIFIPNNKSITEFKLQLDSVGWHNFNKISHVSEIVLTEENHKELDKIRKIKI